MNGTRESISISVVMPTYNEEASLAQVVKDIRKHTSDFLVEILIVDSSSDKTPEIAKGLKIKVIRQPPTGHAVALKTAIESASGDYIITADCDNTYPMESVPGLVSLMLKKNLDVISCNRISKSLKREMSKRNKLANILAAFTVRILYGIRTRDVATGMFCIKRSIVKTLGLKPYPALPPEIIIKAKKRGLNYVEQDIPYRERIGKSKLKFTYAAREYVRVIVGLLFKK